MDFGDSNWFLAPLQILFVDLLLGADNALVIALACRALPPAQVRQAAAIGVVGAMVLRLLLAVVATSLLTLPLIKIAAALALVLIAMNLAAGADIEAEMDDGGRPARDLMSAAGVIIIADLAMSLDNVVALAAIANGNFLWIAIGVALSLPVLGFGGVMLAELLRRAPFLIEFGAAMLGWLAGGMLLADPLIEGWANANAPGLVALAPALGALYVFVYGRWVGAPPTRADETPPPPRQPAPTAAVETPPAAAEPEPPAASSDDRIALIALLLLAAVAAALLTVAAFYDSFN